MNWLSPLLLTIQVVSSLGIIVLILLQQGKGADMGSAFGSGSAGSMFGAAGAANFLSRATKWAGVLFFSSTIGLAYMSHHTGDSILDKGLMQDYQPASAPAQAPIGSAVPVAPSSVVPSQPDTKAQEAQQSQVPGSSSAATE